MSISSQDEMVYSVVRTVYFVFSDLRHPRTNNTLGSSMGKKDEEKAPKDYHQMVQPQSRSKDGSVRARCNSTEEVLPSSEPVVFVLWCTTSLL